MSISRICTLYFGILMAGMVSASAAATHHTKTVSVTERIDLAVPPAKAWDTIQDFMGWPSWHPAFASTELVKGPANTRGSVRLLTAKDGARFSEELVSRDAATRTYEYRIIESPAPVERYLSMLQVKERAGGSTVVWSSRFAVKEGTPEADAKKAISGIYRLGLDNLATMLK
jgi:hypothetical protein